MSPLCRGCGSRADEHHQDDSAEEPPRTEAVEELDHTWREDRLPSEEEAGDALNNVVAHVADSDTPPRCPKALQHQAK